MPTPKRKIKIGFVLWSYCRTIIVRVTMAKHFRAPKVNGVKLGLVSAKELQTRDLKVLHIDWLWYNDFHAITILHHFSFFLKYVNVCKLRSKLVYDPYLLLYWYLNISQDKISLIYLFCTTQSFTTSKSKEAQI